MAERLRYASVRDGKQKEERRMNGSEKEGVARAIEIRFQIWKIDASNNAYIPLPRYKQYIRHIGYTETGGNVASDIR